MKKKKSEDSRFKDFIQNSIFGYFEHDINGNITFVNDNTCKISGFSREEIIGQNMRDFLDEEEEEQKAKNNVRKRKTESETFLAYYTFRAKGGTMKDIEVNSIPIKEGRAIKGFFGTIRDITHRRRMEAELQESEEKYRNIFENIMDVYYRSNLEGILVMASPSAKDLLGYADIDELIGKNIAESFYYYPEDREVFIAELMKTGEVRNYEVTLKHKDGSEVLIPQQGKNPRRLTPREAARLMGFDDSLDIVVSDTQAYRQFGNAVVPLVVEAVGREVMRVLEWQLRRQGNGCIIKGRE